MGLQISTQTENTIADVIADEARIVLWINLQMKFLLISFYKNYVFPNSSHILWNLKKTVTMAFNMKKMVGGARVFSYIKLR